MTPTVLADIYLGKIIKWTDKAIADLNPKLSLPDQAIAVVRRADGSGTTFLFTNYLSKVSPEWQQKVGEGTAVQWPVGLGGKGNEGVAAFVQRIAGAIGYVEFAYALQNKMSYLLLQNADGGYPIPGNASFKAAAAHADWTKSAFYEILTNEPGSESWPITGATFILMQKVQDKPQQGMEVLKFFEWAYKNGVTLAEELHYVALPERLVKTIRASWSEIKDASGKAVFSGN
ncbi:phosphate transport system substrate-binding protein [Gammaproteobacteria bacterium]